jgi:hypothetical protein
MNDRLSPKARAFLRSVQDSDEPTRADFDRVQAQVKIASMAAGAAVVVTAKASGALAATTNATTSGATGIAATGGIAPPAALATGGATLVAKLTVAVLVVGAAAGATTAAVRRASSNEPPRVTVHAGGASGLGTMSQPPKMPRAGAAPVPVTSPSESESASVPVEVLPRAPMPGSVLPRALASAPASKPPSAPPSAPTTDPQPPSSLDGEIALLRDARSALNAGDAALALSLLDQHDRLYPGGVLGEDGAAERIYALCALGEASQARALADRFLASHPSSPHAGAVRASCGAK